MATPEQMLFCPKCGTKNIEGAKFCRGCGADIALIPQALAGHLPETRAVQQYSALDAYDARRQRRRREPPRIDKAISTGFTGFAFLIVAIVLSFTGAGHDWWYWLLIPAFTCMGGGVAEYARFKYAQKPAPELPSAEEPRAAMPPRARASALPPLNTSELVQPPSVTEGTTRHLDVHAEAPTRNISKPAEKTAKDV